MKVAAATTCIVEPPDWRIYISPVLIAISALIAIAAIRANRASARQKATLDLIEKTESTEHYRSASQTFSILRRGDGFLHLNAPQTPEQIKLRRCVNDYLNHYELVAIGVRHGILDANFYKAWMRGPFVRDWNAAADWIQRERWKRLEDGRWESYPAMFEHYQSLACEWSTEAINLNEQWKGPPPDAEEDAIGHEPLPSDDGGGHIQEPST